MTNIEALAKKHPSWNIPTVCPVCGHPLTLNENHTRFICENNSCKRKLIGRVTKWATIHKVKEWAAKTIEKFVDEGFISSLSDVYTLKASQIMNLEGFGEKSAKTLIDNMQAVKKTSFSKFVSGFKILDIGEAQSEKMLEFSGVKTLKELEDKLSKVENFVCPGIGEVTAEKFIKGVKELMPDMKKLNKYVEIETSEKQVTSGNLEGTSFCFTGALDGMKRSDAEELVIKNGGTISAVKKGLTYLVTNTPSSGSSKNKKAQELGVEIIDQKQFLALIGE